MPEGAVRPGTPNTSMALLLALVVTISWDPSGENATCPGVWMNWACRQVGDRGPVRSRDRRGAGRRFPYPDRSAVLGIEDVDELAGDGHAHREGPTRVHHLDQAQLVAGDREDRHRVAPGVHRIEQCVGRVVGERALRGQEIDHRTSEPDPQTSRAIDAGQGEPAVVGPVVGDDLVSGNVVGLDKDDVVGAAPERRSGPPAPTAAGAAQAESPRVPPAPRASRVNSSLCLLHIRGSPRLSPRVGPSVTPGWRKMHRRP